MEVSSIMHEGLKYSSSNTNSFLEQLGKNLSHIAQIHSATYPVQLQVIQNQMRPKFKNHIRPQFQNHARRKIPNRKSKFIINGKQPITVNNYCRIHRFTS